MLNENRKVVDTVERWRQIEHGSDRRLLASVLVVFEIDFYLYCHLGPESRNRLLHLGEHSFRGQIWQKRFESRLNRCLWGPKGL